MASTKLKKHANFVRIKLILYFWKHHHSTSRSNHRMRQEDSIESINVQITEQVSSQNLTTNVTDTSRQVKDRFVNFNLQIVGI